MLVTPATGQVYLWSLDKVESAPKYVYIDGKKTDKQATTGDGQKLYSVKGLIAEVGGQKLPTANISSTIPLDFEFASPVRLVPSDPILNIYTSRQGLGLSIQISNLSEA